MLAALGAHDSDPVATWLSLLAGYVRQTPGAERFEYILSDHRFPQAPRGFEAEPNPLVGASIAETGVLYEFLLAQEDMAAKREKGQFFTPDDVARFMAAQAANFGDGVWLDPCCGVGNLPYWLAERQPSPERFLVASCRFLDLDELSLLTARTLLTVAFQEDDDHLFESLEANFRSGDFLAGDLLNPEVFGDEFDYVLMNPPYVRTRTMNSALRSAPSGDLYAYFLETALMRSRGIVAITPQTFTNGARHAELRQVLIDETEQCDIFSFDNVPDTIFRGLKFGSENTNQVISTRAAITVAKRRKPGPKAASNIRTTPLVRWRSAERERMFKEVEGLLVEAPLCSRALFPKVPSSLATLYTGLCEAPQSVSDVTASAGAETLQLQVPTTPPILHLSHSP